MGMSFWEKRIDKKGKCQNCSGSGQVAPVTINGTVKIMDGTQFGSGQVGRVSSCGYCNGKGWRDTEYGQDKLGANFKDKSFQWVVRGSQQQRQ